jgi:hypothetical protein
MDQLHHRVDALERQLHILHERSRAAERQLRWWRGVACGLLVGALLTWARPSSTAPEDGGLQGLADRVAALETLLTPFTRVGHEQAWWLFELVSIAGEPALFPTGVKEVGSSSRSVRRWASSVDRPAKSQYTRAWSEVLGDWPSLAFDIYDSDRPDATLVGVEVMVSPETDQTFSAAEKARWHAHKTEIPKVAAMLPDLSPEEAAKVVKKMEGTDGKVYLLWDPGKGQPAVGQPSLSILK